MQGKSAHGFRVSAEKARVGWRNKRADREKTIDTGSVSGKKGSSCCAVQAQVEDAVPGAKGGKLMADMETLQVQDVMTKKVATIDGSKTVADAVRQMRSKKVSSLLVDRRSQADAWGIVTRKDVVSKVVDPGKDPSQVKVFEIMTKPLVMVSPGLVLPRPA